MKMDEDEVKELVGDFGETEKEIAICSECKNVIINELISGSSFWKCRKNYNTVKFSSPFLTREGSDTKNYQYCHSINSDGKCESFEKEDRLSLWKRLKLWYCQLDDSIQPLVMIGGIFLGVFVIVGIVSLIAFLCKGE